MMLEFITVRIISTTVLKSKSKEKLINIIDRVTVEADGIPNNSTNQFRAKKGRATKNTTPERNLFTKDKTAGLAKTNTYRPRWFLSIMKNSLTIYF